MEFNYYNPAMIFVKKPQNCRISDNLRMIEVSRLYNTKRNGWKMRGRFKTAQTLASFYCVRFYLDFEGVQFN